jgi:hypothetical protein
MDIAERVSGGCRRGRDRARLVEVEMRLPPRPRSARSSFGSRPVEGGAQGGRVLRHNSTDLEEYTVLRPERADQHTTVLVVERHAIASSLSGLKVPGRVVLGVGSTEQSRGTAERGAWSLAAL